MGCSDPSTLLLGVTQLTGVAALYRRSRCSRGGDSIEALECVALPEQELLGQQEGGRALRRGRLGGLLLTGAANR